MSNKIIKINRGDSYEFDVKITQKNSDEPYILEVGKDIVYFALLFPHQPFEHAKEWQVKGYWAEDNDQDTSTGNIKIKIEPADTRHLMPGVYYYTVKLRRMLPGGARTVLNNIDDSKLVEVRTIVDRTKFIINE